MNKLQQLQWQIDMGVDETLEEDAVDRTLRIATSSEPSNFATNENNLPKTPEIILPKKEINFSVVTSNPRESADKARALADECKSLEDLKEAVENFDGLAIKKTATNTVFADGNSQSEIMFIGEAPGANEDIEGIPFCGESGKLLDDMLSWANLKRTENIYISNTVFWRPPGNRKPTPEELEICKPFVEKHIALINPKILVLVGGTATFSLLETKTGITKLRGEFHNYNNQYLSDEVPVGVLFHPSYLLRQPSQKRLFWKDLLELKQFLQEKKIKV